MQTVSVVMVKGGVLMADCKYYYEEFCVNDKCPMCADYCPVADIPDICKWEDRSDSDGKTTRDSY